MDAVVGIDLGATRVKAGVLRGGRVVAVRADTLTAHDHTEVGIVERLVQVVRQLVADAGMPLESVRAVGIGAPGAIRMTDGVVTLSPNFPEWHEFPLAARLAERLCLPVLMDNDANVVTLGEATYGAGAGVGDFVCFTLGSGVGSGLFIAGDIYRGKDGMAGELGHLTVEPEGFPCNCGNRGCLEQYASSAGLRNMVRRDRLFGDMTDAALEDPDLPRRLYEAAMNGDARCQGYFEEFGYRLAIAVSAVLHTFNVHVIVLQGGLARAMPAFMPKLQAELKGRGYPAIITPARIVPCKLWEEAGVIGAAALAQRLGSTKKAI